MLARMSRPLRKLSGFEIYILRPAIGCAHSFTQQLAQAHFDRISILIRGCSCTPIKYCWRLATTQIVRCPAVIQPMQEPYLTKYIHSPIPRGIVKANILCVIVDIGRSNRTGAIEYSEDKREI